MKLVEHLDAFFRRRAPLAPGESLLVAFSGGTDSLALLHGLAALRGRVRWRLRAAHLDHGLDPGSAARAAAAGALAARLEVPLVVERRPVEQRPGESPEAAARRVRYRFLGEAADRLGARWVATAHQRDDQAETVLLRCLQGSGLRGLAGIPELRERWARPLLAFPRAALAAGLAAAGLEPIDDPTNRAPEVPRNRIRHALLPALERQVPGLAASLARLATAADAALRQVDLALEERLQARVEGPAARVPVASLLALPEPLRAAALTHLHRLAGRPYPPSGRAVAALLSALAGGRAVERDAGGGDRWRRRGGWLELLPASARGPSATPRFRYALFPPGELALPEIGARLRLDQRPAEPWMVRGAQRRTGLRLPGDGRTTLTVRNRRPGDRIHPLGAPGSRKLKELLIDRRVPREERDRLPLLCHGERILWVPGVTIDDGCRIEADGPVWVAELLPGDPTEARARGRATPSS